MRNGWGSAPAGKPGEPVAIRTRAWPAGERLAAVSRSHFEAASAAFLDKLAPVTKVACGSALKFCRVAEGAIDVYPRLAPTSEWDIAAGHALVVAAGGAMTAPDGSVLAYGRGAHGFRVPGFVAWGDAARSGEGVTAYSASPPLTSAQRADAEAITDAGLSRNVLRASAV